MMDILYDIISLVTPRTRNSLTVMKKKKGRKGTGFNTNVNQILELSDNDS